MTLVIAAINKTYCVQVSDRRLTTGENVTDEEHEKSFLLHLPGFTFSVAFSGLAAVGSHLTKEFLMQQLADSYKFALNPVEVLTNLVAGINGRYKNLAAIRQLGIDQKALTISIVGYNYSLLPPKGLAAEISNIGDPNGAFTIHHSGVAPDAPDDWTWVGIFGSGAPAAKKFHGKICEKLRAGIPPDQVSNILIDMVRAAAKDPISASSVGEQLDSIIFFSDPALPAFGGGSTMINQTYVRLPSMVSLSPNGGQVLTDLVFEEVGDDPAPLAVQRVGRNALCPCGSQKKYKRCHGVN